MKNLGLKIAALFSYCGGPLFIADLLKRHSSPFLAFLLTFLPVGLMTIGALSLDDDPRSRWSRFIVSCGRQSLFIVLAMHLYALWSLLQGNRVPDLFLHALGIAVGVAWSVVYLRAARRWTASPTQSGDRSLEPIEPS